MNKKYLLIIGLLTTIHVPSFGFWFRKNKTVQVPVVVQQKKNSRFTEWKKRWTFSEYTALLSGIASAGLVSRGMYDIGSEGREAIQKFWGGVGYVISTAITGIPRYISSGTVFGDPADSLWTHVFGSSFFSSLATVGISAAAIATPLLLRTPRGYAYRAKWNLDLIESYYLNRSDDLLRSISITQKKDLEKKLAHVRRMLVLALPGIGVAKVIDKPWLPIYNAEKTAQYIEQLKNRYMQYANHLIATIPHLSVEIGF